MIIYIIYYIIYYNYIICNNFVQNPLWHHHHVGHKEISYNSQKWMKKKKKEET